MTSKGNGARLVAATIAPFAQTLNHGGEEHRAADLREPLATVTGANDARALVAALVTKHYGGNEGPGSSAAAPFDAITAKDHNALTVAYISKHYGNPGYSERPGTSAELPLSTITASDHHAVSCAYLSQMYGSNRGTNGDVSEPAAAVTGAGNHASLVAAFLDTYYGNSKDGGSIDGPSPTVVSKDRISLVTVVIEDVTYVITDIAMRMLTPRELMLAQGFPPAYRVDVMADGTRVSKADQVKLIGNAVPPPFARALAFANVVEQGVLGEPPARKAVRS